MRDNSVAVVHHDRPLLEILAMYRLILSLVTHASLLESLRDVYKTADVLVKEASSGDLDHFELWDRASKIDADLQEYLLAEPSDLTFPLADKAAARAAANAAMAAIVEVIIKCTSVLDSPETRLRRELFVEADRHLKNVLAELDLLLLLLDPDDPDDDPTRRVRSQSARQIAHSYHTGLCVLAKQSGVSLAIEISEPRHFLGSGWLELSEAYREIRNRSVEGPAFYTLQPADYSCSIGAYSGEYQKIAGVVLAPERQASSLYESFDCVDIIEGLRECLVLVNFKEAAGCTLVSPDFSRLTGACSCECWQPEVCFGRPTWFTELSEVALSCTLESFDDLWKTTCQDKLELTTTHSICSSLSRRERLNRSRSVRRLSLRCSTSCFRAWKVGMRRSLLSEAKNELASFSHLGRKFGTRRLPHKITATHRRLKIARHPTQRPPLEAVNATRKCKEANDTRDYGRHELICTK